jgi:DNA-binding XRE family transcriptional regulator
MTPALYKAERLKRELTQSQLADIVGVSRGCINYREAGHPRYPITKEAWLAIKALPKKPATKKGGRVRRK